MTGRGKFARALEANPELLGWKGVDVDRLGCTARIEGRLPSELQGTFYRNGPAVHERFGLRYQHLFDGDGMVQAFRFDGRGVTHRARVLATPKLVRETEAEPPALLGVRHSGRGGRRCFAVPATSTPPTSPCSTITASCSRCGRAALRACSTARRSSGTASRCGARDSRTCRSPRTREVEADGTLWAFGYSLVPVRALLLYHIAPNGTVVKAHRVDPGPLGMVHDFVVTDRHLVVVIPPLAFEPSHEGELLDALAWRPELGTRALVVDKNDFNARRWVQLPCGIRLSPRQRVGGCERRHPLRPLCRGRPDADDRDDARPHARPARAPVAGALHALHALP